MIQKSKGHIGFSGDLELFEFGGNLYRAQKSDVIDVNEGVRVGARFEGYGHSKGAILKRYGL